MSQNPPTNIEYLFIAGCARSGTSVLRRLISADPNAAIGLERYVHYLFANGGLTADLFEPARFLDIRKGDTFYDDFAAFRENDEIVAHYPTARIRGDKIPRIYDFYPQLRREFPDARFIFIVRDLFDVALSFERRARNVNDRSWSVRRGYEAAIEEWNRAINSTLDWADRLNLCVVSYENLFFSGVGAAELSRFAGLDRQRLEARLKQQREFAKKIGHQGEDASLPVEKIRARVQDGMDREAYTKLMSRYLCNPVGSAAPAAGGRPPDGARSPEKKPPKGLRKYVGDDVEVFDYQCYPLGDYPLWVRGPKQDVDPGRPYAVVLGAASAFGRCVARPYAELLSEHLGMPVLNLGFGGAKPGLYLDDAGLRRLISDAAVSVVEFMSARGFANSLVEARDSHSAFVRLRADQQEPAGRDFRGLLARLFGRRRIEAQQPAEWRFADRIYERLVREGDSGRLLKVVSEIRDAYTEQMQQLLQLCSGVKILFWFSQRRPAYPFSTRTFNALTGGFPHFVDAKVVSAIRPAADGYVELCSTSGLPTRMTSRFTGKPVALFPHNEDPSLNFYYPSPEMHDEAAQLLHERIAPLLSSRHGA